MRKVYIAGPMRSCPDWNFGEFDRAAERWRNAGWQPFSPAQIDRALQYGPETASGEDPSHLRHVIAIDLACISHADALALLPGWQRSAGATVELALALFLSLPVYNAVTMERIYPETKPWSDLRIQTTEMEQRCRTTGIYSTRGLQHFAEVCEQKIT